MGDDTIPDGRYVKVGILTYSLSAAGLVVGILIGWLFRHRVLDRLLFQTRKQLSDMKALHMNLEHEISSVRQKIIQQEDNQNSMKSMLVEADSQQKKAEEAFRKIEEMQEHLASIKQDNEELEEQIAYLEAEKSNLQKFREQAQEKMQQIAGENRQLREMISELQQAGVQNTRGGMRSESAPVVRRIPPPEGTGDQGQHSKQQEKGQPSTSRIKTREAESTDRVKTRESGKRSADKEPASRLRQAPTSAIPVRSAVQLSGSGVGERFDNDSVTEEESGELGIQPEFMETIDAGTAVEPETVKNNDWDNDAEENPVDEDTGIRDLQAATPAVGKSVNDPPKPRKKKPKTVRIDRTTSDIIDSFKRDLGLPGK